MVSVIPDTTLTGVASVDKARGSEMKGRRTADKATYYSHASERFFHPVVYGLEVGTNSSWARTLPAH